jgi:hypothetical protein
MSGINNAVLPSSALHRDTTVDAVPAVNRPRVGCSCCERCCSCYEQTSHHDTLSLDLPASRVASTQNHSRTTSKFNVSLNFGNEEVCSLAGSCLPPRP